MTRILLKHEEFKKNKVKIKDKNTIELIDELLVQMAKLEMKIGYLILEYRHAS